MPLVRPHTPVDPRLLAALTLCLEVTLPTVLPGRPLRLWQGAAPDAAAIALYAVGEGRLRLVHGDVDVTTPPDFVRSGETVSLRYSTCSRGRSDVVEFVSHHRDQRFRMRCGVARAARLDEAWPRDPGFLSVCHVAAVAGMGLRSGDLPALSAGTLLQTVNGPRPVESLQVDDILLTVTGERLPLRWIERRPRLCLGRNAPVLLRAPYFGLDHDICVSPQTRIMRSGPEVEYNFGHERVLVRADDLTASPGALRDLRQPVRDFYHLMLDDHACLAVDRCGVETALLADVLAAEDWAGGAGLVLSDRTPCLPALDRAAAQALVAATAKGRHART